MEYNKVLVSEVDVAGKVVFLRLDLNVPVIDGKITSMKRIKASIPTIEYLIQNHAKVVILSHLGRVKTLDDVKDGRLSLEIVAREIAREMLPRGAASVTFINKNTGENVEQLIHELPNSGILVLENVRYNDLGRVRRESGKDAELARYWADLSDVFINDAYGTAHRDHASTSGIAEFQKNNGIGFLMDEELKHMEKAVDDAKSPFVVIFGGAKVSDKLKAVEKCLLRADKVIISGGMAYTFLKAQGFDMGKSNVEDDLLETARDLMKKYPEKLVVSNDFECAPEFADVPPTYRTAEEGLNGMIGLDIGPKSIEAFKEIIGTANTILWNGPMGVTEFSNYEHGTAEICRAIAERTAAGAYTVIGGGDSAAAAEKLGMEASFSWISTGGGASLKFLSGEPLPALIPIRDRIGNEPERSIDLEKEFFGAKDVEVCPACGAPVGEGDQAAHVCIPQPAATEHAEQTNLGNHAAPEPVKDHPLDGEVKTVDDGIRPRYDAQWGVNRNQEMEVKNGWATPTGYDPEPGTSGRGEIPAPMDGWKRPAPVASDDARPQYDPRWGVNRDKEMETEHGWATQTGYDPNPTEHTHEHDHDVVHEHEHEHADGTVHDHFHEHALEHDHPHDADDNGHLHEHDFTNHDDHSHNVDHDHPDADPTAFEEGVASQVAKEVPAQQDFHEYEDDEQSNAEAQKDAKSGAEDKASDGDKPVKFMPI